MKIRLGYVGLSKTIDITSSKTITYTNYLKSKDFEGMTKEWKKIQNNLKSIIPLENILKQVRQIENIYNLIKNNGNNFELSQDELEIIKKI